MDKKYNKKRKEYGPRVNERIRIPKIRVINEDGKMLGIMSPSEALQIAKQQGLDLVEIVPTARPPVCKIIEYGKYKYEQSKKQGSTATKKNKFKEIKFHPRIDEHDYQTKKKKDMSIFGKRFTSKSCGGISWKRNAIQALGK